MVVVDVVLVVVVVVLLVLVLVLPTVDGTLLSDLTVVPSCPVAMDKY